MVHVKPFNFLLWANWSGYLNMVPPKPIFFSCVPKWALQSVGYSNGSTINNHRRRNPTESLDIIMDEAEPF